ncbi:hypothetical protein L5515_016082 [Caenorhabditis briggsae]|uniref:Uncharacterized protein n=1 Tax=Caenorhabditis briggsae TaxID=6238 RepID=A0AAE9JQS3_CAEBR|nr:hypothetical protein L5515_016082 [Caenorhabditis briggsae]
MGNAYSKPPVLVRRWLKPSKKVDEPRKLLQSMQLEFDRQLAEQYGTIEKNEIRRLFVRGGRRDQGHLPHNVVPGRQNRVISKRIIYTVFCELSPFVYHSMWDMYNLMAIEHVQELGLHIKTLSCIARKVVIVRARIFQCLCMDEYCTRDYQIYDHLNN